MRFVGFFVDSEVGQGGGLFHAVEFAQAVDLGAGNFGDLRFISVERGDGFGYGTVAANFAERGDYGLCPGRAGEQVMSSSPTPTAAAKSRQSFGCGALGFSSSARFSNTVSRSGPSVRAARTRRCLGEASTWR